jgi:hypothetical protein
MFDLLLLRFRDVNRFEQSRSGAQRRQVRTFRISSTCMGVNQDMAVRSNNTTCSLGLPRSAWRYLTALLLRHVLAREEMLGPLGLGERLGWSPIVGRCTLARLSQLLGRTADGRPG